MGASSRCTNDEGCLADEHGPDTCPGARMGYVPDLMTALENSLAAAKAGRENGS